MKGRIALEDYRFIHPASGPGSRASRPPAPRFVVEATGVEKIYRVGGADVAALRGVSLAVRPGEFLAIAGPSGSGKSTLLNLIGCLEAPTAGAVKVSGYDVRDLSADERAEIRLSLIGFVFQNFNLLPVLTAVENVEAPLYLRGEPRRLARARAVAALESVGLATHAAHRPSQLSGGQRQRVAIARAMVTRPRLVLADEPTANLDHATGVEIIELMRRINRDMGATFIFSTHDPKITERASRVVTLADGAVAKEEVR